MRTRILPLLITMLFALSLASNAAANENSKMTPGTIPILMIGLTLEQIQAQMLRRLGNTITAPILRC